MNINITNARKALIYTLFLNLVLVFSAWAGPGDVKNSQELKQYISTSMNQLLLKLETHKLDYKNDSALFYRDLNIELSKVIDFKRIALKVMGKHGRTATKAQSAQFISVFKSSLYKTYAQVLLDNNEVEIDVINATLNPRNIKKAKVNIEIKSARGLVFDVSYSLHKGKDQIYRIENIVVMGINLGLAFKDRFQQQVKVNKGDINAVIDNWRFDDAV